jgi:GNAT superfamily N-acetyltransferase
LLASLFSIEKDFTPDPARQIAGLKLMLPREDILLWVAEEILEDETKVVGFCSVQTLISTAEGSVVGLIEDVVVPDEWRRAGIGRQLLEGAEAWARRRGCSRLQLLADEGNEPAQAFYTSQGWLQTRMRNWRRMLREA